MLASGALLFVLAGFPQDGKAVDEALRAFRSDYSRPGVRDEDRIRAVETVSRHRHEKVARALAPLLIQAPLPVRIVTARKLACFQDVPCAADSLHASLVHGRNSGKNGRSVRISILQALGSLKASGAARTVDKLVRDDDVWVAKAAIEAAGKIRAKSSVDVLVQALKRLDGSQGDRDVALDLFEGQIPRTDMRGIILREATGKDGSVTERDVLRGPLMAALSSITRMSFSCAREWQSWWQDHRRVFTVPP